MAETFSTELTKLIKDLKVKKKMIAMLAPSFVIDFDCMTIVKKLKEIGFDKVTEVTFGAKIVNEEYHKILKENSDFKISSACPTIIFLIKTQFPHYKKNLVKIVSPMVAMGRILKKNYPKHKVVFIGPCFQKKLEAKIFSKDIYNALTFKELKQLFEYWEKEKLLKRKIKTDSFDSFYNDYTKIYPLTGGMKDSLHYKGIVHENKIVVEDGIPNLIKLLNSDMPEHIEFLDILNCPGGCIGGPGIISKESERKRKEKIKKYLKISERKKIGGKRIGLNKFVKGIDFTRKDI